MPLHASPCCAAASPARTEQILALIGAGTCHVAPERRGAWKEFVLANSQDPYSRSVVEATVDVMSGLSAGQGSDDALRARLRARDLSRHQIAIIAGVVAHFHPQGGNFEPL